MIKRKYILLSLLTLVSILFGSLLYSSLVSAQNPTVTGYVSVPAAAFMLGGWNYPGKWSIHDYIRNEDMGGRTFPGSVQLPHGATVTKVTFYWYDDNASNLDLELWRYNLTHIQRMTDYIKSSGSAGYGSSYDDTIDYATVDNNRYAYWLTVWIPYSESHTDYLYKYAVIEYTLPSEAVGVGGLYIPVDKFSLLAPYITLVVTIILAVSISVAYIKHRKKQ